MSSLFWPNAFAGSVLVLSSTVFQVYVYSVSCSMKLDFCWFPVASVPELYLLSFICILIISNWSIYSIGKSPILPAPSVPDIEMPQRCQWWRCMTPLCWSPVLAIRKMYFLPTRSDIAVAVISRVFFSFSLSLLPGCTRRRSIPSSLTPDQNFRSRKLCQEGSKQDKCVREQQHQDCPDCPDCPAPSSSTTPPSLLHLLNHLPILFNQSSLLPDLSIRLLQTWLRKYSLNVHGSAQRSMWMPAATRPGLVKSKVSLYSSFHSIVPFNGLLAAFCPCSS